MEALEKNIVGTAATTATTVGMASSSAAVPQGGGLQQGPKTSFLLNKPRKYKPKYWIPELEMLQWDLRAARDQEVIDREKAVEAETRLRKEITQLMASEADDGHVSNGDNALDGKEGGCTKGAEQQEQTRGPFSFHSIGEHDGGGDEVGEQEKEGRKVRGKKGPSSSASSQVWTWKGKQRFLFQPSSWEGKNRAGRGIYGDGEGRGDEKPLSSVGCVYNL